MSHNNIGSNHYMQVPTPRDSDNGKHSFNNHNNVTVSTVENLDQSNIS